MQKKLHVALVCTGTICENKSQPEQCREYLQNNFGFTAEYGDDAFTKLPSAERAERLLNYCLRDDIDIIWAARGGEGTADLLPFLAAKQALLQKAKQKIIIGFSDFTPMLVYFQQNFHWPTIHGPGASQFVVNTLDEKTIEATKQLLIHHQFGGIQQLTPLNDAARKENKISAHLIGGCLSLLNISIKDSWEVHAANKILIIEDVNEKPHVVWRTLKYLQRVHFFVQAKAVILGDIFRREADEKEVLCMEKYLQQFADSCTFPVLKTNAFGHGSTNLPLPFFTPLELITGQHCYIEPINKM